MTINTFASSRQFLGIATEATQGTAVAPVATIPFEKFEPEDKPVWLDDKALRGSMAELFGKQQGVIKTDFSLSGPVYGDTIGFLFANILGDNSTTGTGTTPTTTTTGALAVGATSIPVTSGTGFTNATNIVIGTGTTAEVVTIVSGAPAGPFVIASPGVRYAHLTNAAVTQVTSPYTRQFGLLNSGNGQPVSHTFTHYQGPAATTGARVYAGACLSELNLKWNAESNLFQYDAKGSCYPSTIAGSTPTSSPSTVQPIAPWRGKLGLAGPATGGTLVPTIESGEFDIKRTIEPIFTVQGLQSPYFIQRGVLSVAGKMSFVAADESSYLYMINNTQPQMQFLLDNGQSGTSDVTVQVDMQVCAFTAAKYNAGKSAIRFDVSFEGVANSTNATGSGGLSPLAVTLKNAVSPTLYN
jgi:hypothetical protein